MAHHVTFGDFMAGNILAGDFLTRSLHIYAYCILHKKSKIVQWTQGYCSSHTYSMSWYAYLLTGSEGGLRLQLNIEQYEYMKGPNPGAGLKLQIHNQEDVPMVKDHGIAVPPGSHGFVAVKTVEVVVASMALQAMWYKYSYTIYI